MKLKGSGSGQMVHIWFTQTGIMGSLTTRMELKITLLSIIVMGGSGQMSRRTLKHGSFAKKHSPDHKTKIKCIIIVYNCLCNLNAQ